MTACRVATLALAIVALASASAQANITTGALEGRVTDKQTGLPLPGVEVVVFGPARAGRQVEHSDARGAWFATSLPPGVYTVRFVYKGAQVDRTDIAVDAQRTLAVHLAFPTALTKANQ